ICSASARQNLRWRAACTRSRRRYPMRDLRVSIPELAFVGGTRGILGAGLGMLLAGQFSHRTRKRIGVALFVLGALTTIPVFIGIRRRAGANGHVKRGMDERAVTDIP